MTLCMFLFSAHSIIYLLRIRILMVLGLHDPDPDPLVRDMDQAPDPSIIKQK
jgi:hypothetical protein